MNAYCAHCRTPREVKQYDGQWQCTFCGHVFNDKPDSSPPDQKEQQDKLREHPFQKHAEIYHE